MLNKAVFKNNLKNN
jgi:hypothetical protein